MSHNWKRKLKNQLKYFRRSRKYLLSLHKRKKNSKKILPTNLKMLLTQPNCRQSSMQNQTQIVQMMKTMVSSRNNSKV